MQKAIPTISKQMLVNQLRELEQDKIVEKIIFNESPRRIEYRITEYGRSLMPVIGVMQAWGISDLGKKAIH